MNPETIFFEISQDLLAALKLGREQLKEEMRLLAAIAYFQGKKLSLGKAAELAGINRLEFMDILLQKGITLFDYDETKLETELRGISQLRGENDS